MPTKPQTPQPSNTDLIQSLQTVYRAADFLRDLEGQDISLILEMSQAMINDLIETGEFQRTLEEYVRHYCDCYESEDELAAIIADI